MHTQTLSQKARMGLAALALMTGLFSQTATAKPKGDANKADWFKAAQKGDASAIKSLIKKGAKVSWTDEDNQTALHVVVFVPGPVGRMAPPSSKDTKAHLEALKALLKAKANPNATDKEGNTPLHLLLGSSFPTWGGAQELVLGGGKVNALNKAGQTPLDRYKDPMANRMVDPMLEKFLEDHGAKSGAALGGNEVCRNDSSGQSLGFQAALSSAKANEECKKVGAIQEKHWCNSSTGTWWISLNGKKPNCSVACVVDVDTGNSRVNWMCAMGNPSGKQGKGDH